MRELANSMEQVGLMQPILVRPIGERFELVAGERRIRAAKMLGWTSIAAIVEVLSDLKAALRTFVENEQRQDVNPLERARGLKRFADPPFSLTHDDIAKGVGIEKSVVTRLLELLAEPSEIQELVAHAAITPGHVRALKALDDDSERVELATQAANKHWGVRETGRRAHRTAKGGKSGEGKPPENSGTAWEIFRRVIEVLRGVALVQRILKWLFAWMVPLIPGHESTSVGSLPRDAEPPDSKSSKAA